MKGMNYASDTHRLRIAFANAFLLRTDYAFFMDNQKERRGL